MGRATLALGRRMVKGLLTLSVITLNPKARLVVNTQPQQPAGQGAGNNGNLAASEIVGAK